MLLNIIVLLLGLAAIAIDVKSIITLEATFWSSDDSDGNRCSHRVVEVFPAIVVGLLEIAVGIYILIEHRNPLPF